MSGFCTNHVERMGDIGSITACASYCIENHNSNTKFGYNPALSTCDCLNESESCSRTTGGSGNIFNIDDCLAESN